MGLSHEHRPQATPNLPAASQETTADWEIVPDTEMKHRKRANVVAALHKSASKIYQPDRTAEPSDLKPTRRSARIKKMGIKQPTENFSRLSFSSKGY
jgi:hypothetical protein